MVGAGGVSDVSGVAGTGEASGVTGAYGYGWVG